MPFFYQCVTTSGQEKASSDSKVGWHFLSPLLRRGCLQDVHTHVCKLWRQGVVCKLLVPQEAQVHKTRHSWSLERCSYHSAFSSNSKVRLHAEWLVRSFDGSQWSIDHKNLGSANIKWSVSFRRFSPGTYQPKIRLLAVAFTLSCSQQVQIGFLYFHSLYVTMLSQSKLRSENKKIEIMSNEGWRHIVSVGKWAVESFQLKAGICSQRHPGDVLMRAGKVSKDLWH